MRYDQQAAVIAALCLTLGGVVAFNPFIVTAGITFGLMAMWMTDRDVVAKFYIGRHVVLVYHPRAPEMQTSEPVIMLGRYRNQGRIRITRILFIVILTPNKP